MDMLKTLGPAQASEIALTRLSEKLAECIAPMMMIETENDLSAMSQRVRATVKIVRPAGR